jgi:RND family efflux transporter MFP subunit
MAFRKKTPRWWWLALVVLVGGVGGLWYWGTTASESSPTAGARPPGAAPLSPAPGQPVVERLPVKTLAAKKRDLAVTLPVFGAVTYLSKVEVAPEVQGVIKQVLVEPGDLVRKNQVLAVLDTELLEKEMQTRTAMRAQAEALLHNARWQYQARQKLYKVGGASLSATEEAEAQFQARLAEVQRYTAEVAQIRTQIQKSTIRAPIAGVVASRNFNPGEMAPTLGRREDKGLVTLMRLDEVYVQAEVSERDLARLRPGLEVVVVPDAYPTARLAGKLERLEPVLKEESRTVAAKVRVPNPDYRLKPGMFARLEIVLDKTPQVVAVPKTAFQTGPDKSPRVFVVVDEVAFSRKVVPGAATEHWVEIRDGLKPEDQVVVEGAEGLKDLARVVSTPASPPLAR